jgi:hypothetical protein
MTDANPPTEPRHGLRLIRTENLELRKQVLAFQAALRIIRNGVDNPSEFAAAVLEQWGHEP